MKRRILALALVLSFVLSLTPALAADGDLFPPVAAMPAFTDVSPDGSGGAWYDYESVKVCVEAGMMKGANGAFNPRGAITVAEVAVIAARMCGNTFEEPIPEGTNWYDGHMALLKKHVDDLCALLNQTAQELADSGLYTPEEAEALFFSPKTQCPALFKEPLAPATKADFVALLNLGVLLDDPINEISRLPDTSDPTVLAFYNAGIVTGSDYYGTFEGDKGLTRAEAAAMVARIVRPSLRKQLYLLVPRAPKSEAQSAWQEDHPMGGWDDALLALVLGLNRYTALSPSGQEWFCYDLGLDSEAVLLYFQDNGGLPGTQLLPYFCTMIDTLMTSALEEGKTVEEFWSATYRFKDSGEPLSNDGYLKYNLKTQLAKLYLLFQGNDSPTADELAAVRDGIVESPAFQSLNSRELYEYASLACPQALYSAEEWAELSGSNYEE